MPHVIVKLWSGRTEAQKAKLSRAVTDALMESLGTSEESISVAIEDVAPGAWRETVVEPDILAKPRLIYKKPGYTI